MPDLTTMTRQEKFLNGDTDLEPITRREHFYAGRESELPEGHQEPETREEWFIQKYRGGGGDVTVVPLSVTENGTYSEEGNAYSPVRVNVPLPQNAYLLKSVNTPTPIASFNDGEEMVMPSLKVAIEPQQDLSHGDPSPTNICPISGWTEANVTVADDVENPTVSNVYTIDLDGTRYGGTLDVVSGVLTVDRKNIKINTKSWNYNSSRQAFNTLFSDKDISKNLDVISSVYKNGGIVLSASDVANKESGALYFQTTSDTIFIKDTRFTTETDLLNEVGNETICYYLMTPLAIQLTPTQVKSLLGQNNVWADTGDIKDAEYFSKEV